MSDQRIDKRFVDKAKELITTLQHEMQNASSIPTKIIVRVTQLAEALELDYERFMAWIFLRIMISAQWFIEDNDDPNQMLALANHVYRMT